MKNILIFLIVFTFAVVSKSNSQDELVNQYLSMIAAGQIDDVKMKLPDLFAEYPNDPGVQLLLGVVLDDAYKALDIYNKIIKNNPESPWADNAYWRVIQFYAITGDTTNARLSLHKFRQQYPSSVYLVPASDVVRSSINFARAGKIHTPVVNKITEQKEKPETINKAVPETKDPMVKPTTESNPGTEELMDVDDSEAVWGLQVGIFRSKETADKEMNKFLRQRMRTEVIEKKVEGEKMWAVVIGNYSSKDSAEAAKQIVEQQCGCMPIVFKK